MNHVIVTRVAIGVVTLCTSAALLFAYLATPNQSHARVADAAVTQESDAQATAHTQATPHAGAELFDRHCSGCHTLSEGIEFVRVGGSDLNANAKAMVAFLKTHGKSDDAQDLLIVDYLRQQAK